MRVFIFCLLLVACVPESSKSGPQSNNKGEAAIVSSIQTGGTTSTISLVAEAKTISDNVVPEKKINAEELGTLSENIALTDQELAILLQGQTNK